MTPDAQSTDTEFWRRARQLFLDVCTLPLSERDAFLDTADAGEDVIEAVRRLLLQQDQRTDPQVAIDPGALADIFAAVLGRAEQEPAPVLGEFRIERTLGEGGMGRVYLAVRETGDVVQRVALKVVPLAANRPRLMEQLRRERAILAGLEHPHIARLIDTGELPDGRPFFAMEYVDGVPLLRYCDEARLDLRARLGLFLDVCEAVSYAHRRLVLHRDLKDSNILVDASGRARLLDFGIAKSLDDAQARDTTQGQNYFSLRAAAPEQIKGAATTVATDVYGLGCLLYELLSGRLPFDLLQGSGEELLRRILQQPPPLASVAAAAADDTAATQRGLAGAVALAAALRGDLDAVVARTLRKDPAERYASVDHLAADLHNVLAQRPIAERASERWYRLRMLLRRHRLTAAVATVLGVAVIATTALSVVQSLRAATERDRAVAALEAAQLQRDHAQQVTDFLVNAFQAADREGLTRDLTAVKLLDNAAAALERDSTRLTPVLRTTLAQTLAHLFYLLQRKPEAIRLTEFARRELEATPDMPRDVRVRQFLVDAESDNVQNRYDDAVKAATAGLELAGDAAEYNDDDVLYMLWDVKLRTLISLADNTATIQAADSAIAQMSRRSDIRQERLDWIRLYRARAHYALERAGEYREQLLQLVAEQRQQGRDNGAAHIRALRDLAHAYKIHNEEEQALPIIAEALAKQYALFGDDHPMTPALLGGLASAYFGVGRKREGIELTHHAIAEYERYYGKVNITTANAYFYLAENYVLDMNDVANAVLFARKALRAAPAQARGSLSLIERRLANLLARQGDWFEAAYHAERAVDGLIATYGLADFSTEDGVVDLAYIQWRRYDLVSAQSRLTGSLLLRVREHLDGRTLKRNYSYEKAQAKELSAVFGWSRDSDGSTIAPPLRR